MGTNWVLGLGNGVSPYGSSSGISRSNRPRYGSDRITPTSTAMSARPEEQRTILELGYQCSSSSSLRSTLSRHPRVCGDAPVAMGVARASPAVGPASPVVDLVSPVAPAFPGARWVSPVDPRVSERQLARFRNPNPGLSLWSPPACCVPSQFPSFFPGFEVGTGPCPGMMNPPFSMSMFGPSGTSAAAPKARRGLRSNSARSKANFPGCGTRKGPVLVSVVFSITE